MIIFQALKWSNWFSYGPDNKIEFTGSTVTQLLGKVGAGKTSIPIILQEVLYGKNNKGFKKSQLANRDLNMPISAELTFMKDKVSYMIELKRASTLKLSILKDGEDISAHTAQGTYKLIETIIGIDFKLFCQLTYQSSKNSLEFLTSTDTQRKKFLISLFDLDIYLKYHDGYKAIVKGLVSDISEIKGSIDTISTWIERNPNTEFTERKLLSVPDEPDTTELIEKQGEFKSIEEINRTRSRNTQYIELRNEIDVDLLTPLVYSGKEASSYLIKKSKTEQKVEDLTTNINRMHKLGSECLTCHQPIDLPFKEGLITEYSVDRQNYLVELTDLSEAIRLDKKRANEFNKHKENIEEFERLNSLINPDTPSTLLDKDYLNSEITSMKDSIKEVKDNIKRLKELNEAIVGENNNNEFLFNQHKQLSVELNTKAAELVVLEDLLYDLVLLKDTFSTGGLVSYKIKYLVSDLEAEISKYLQQLSDGRFQLEFKLVEDKLNIAIFDSGEETSIVALSSGQLAVVNIATLLAIRKLLSTISSTKLNILFLDETIGTLDQEYKESLIEVLLEEKDLNIFLVSHEWTHPLVPSITIVNDGVSYVGRQ